jgi:hypothetical protein
MKRITKNGELLSGKSSPKDYVVEKFNEIYALLSEPEQEVFDISNIKEKDKLFINGKWRNVTKSNDGRLRVRTGDYSHTRELVIDVKELIEQHEKYVPKIQYNGSVAYIESYILDRGTLIYLELSGQESMVKSITSVLMQGRTKINEQVVNADALGYFQINKKGNKRKLTSLGDGIAHSILYHAPSIASTDFNILIGRDEQELNVSFQAWLEKSQPMPYPKELANNIFKEMQERELLQSVKVFNVEALKIDEEIKKENYEILQYIIISICKDKGLIDSNAVPMKIDAPLPQSPVLSEEQVQKIFDTLKNMPKSYELEDISVKPIGLKLFGPNFTYYIVEADKGSEDDEFTSSHTQCFGYVKNESDPQSSEWGYINVQEILSSGNNFNYYERDLHFNDMFIDSSGNIGKKEDLSSNNANDAEIKCPSCNGKSVVIVESSEYSLCGCTKCGHNHKVYSKEVA